MKLAILIPTLESRKTLLERLLTELRRQKQEFHNWYDIEFIMEKDNGGMETGMKRNKLIESAIKDGAEYISFIDDDDLPGPTYIQRGLEVVKSGMDCGELWGQYYSNGKKGNPFHHSIEYDHWYQDEKTYFRNPNHLNFLRLDSVKDIRYPDITIGEDGQYSIALQKSGVLKTQYPIPEIIYHYFSGEPKHEI